MNMNRIFLDSDRELTSTQFFREYWQKKPLFIKGAFTPPKKISDEQIYSWCEHNQTVHRLVHSPKISGEGMELRDWTGAGSELASGETLLVQQTEFLDPELLKIKKHFSFIPNWRFDDIMLSLAREGATTGPHVDSYDVFIYQWEGKRRWRVEKKHRSPEECEGSHLLALEELKILAHFRECDEWELEAGDLLYIPVGHAHWGVSESKNLSCSIGFQAPTLKETLLHHFSSYVEQFPDTTRLKDASTDYAKLNSGEIPSDIFASINPWPDEIPRPGREMIHWYGSLITTSLRDELEEETFDEEIDCLETYLGNCSHFRFRPSTRMAYFLWDKHTLLVFVNGQEFILPRTLENPLIKLVENMYDKIDKSVLESGLQLEFERWSEFLRGLIDEEILKGE